MNTIIPLTPEREAAIRRQLRSNKACTRHAKSHSITFELEGSRDATVTHKGAAILIYVRNASKPRRELQQLCNRTGAVAELEWEASPTVGVDGTPFFLEPDCWKLVASPEVIESLWNVNARPWWVKEVELTVSAHVSGGTGAGDVSMKAKKAARESRVLRVKANETAPTDREHQKREIVESLLENLAKKKRLKEEAEARKQA